MDQDKEQKAELEDEAHEHCTPGDLLELFVAIEAAEAGLLPQ